MEPFRGYYGIIRSVLIAPPPGLKPAAPATVTSAGRSVEDRVIWGLTFHQLMVGLLFGAIAFCACLMPAQSDTYWHLRAGQEIWQTLRVPLDEHYSFSAFGRFWPDHEWLWQAISFGLYRFGGPRLLVLGGAAIVTSACVVVYRLMVGPTATRFALMVLGLPMATCVWSLRPQILSLLLLAVMLWLLVRERYWALPVLFVGWANAHGAVAMGGAVLAAVTVAALVRARQGDAGDRQRARTLALVTPICALGTALTPLGFRLWRFIGTSMALSRENRILEWQPTLPDGPFGIVFWTLALGFLLVVVWRARHLRARPWGDLVLLTASLVMLPLAFRAVRNTAVFLLVAIPTTSRLLGPEFRFRRRASPPPSVDCPRLNLLLLAGITLIEALGVGLAWRLPLARLGWHPLAPGALAAVRSCPARAFNRYNEGGYLLWFAPERRVLIDSRQDPYPSSLMKELADIDHGGPYQNLFSRYGIRCAFLPADSKLVGRLRADGWQTPFWDDQWAVMTPLPPH